MVCAARPACRETPRRTHTHTTQTPSKMSAAPGSAVARLSPGPLLAEPQWAEPQWARPLTRLREGSRLHVADSNP